MTVLAWIAVIAVYYLTEYLIVRIAMRPPKFDRVSDPDKRLSEINKGMTLKLRHGWNTVTTEGSQGD